MERFEKATNEHETGLESPQELIDIVEKMEEVSESSAMPLEEKIKELRDLTSGLLEHIHGDLKMELSVEVSRLYEEMHRNDLLARVERIKDVIECIANHKPIHVGDKDKHYANSVTTDKEGLRIAMSEAEAIGPIRLLVGLDLNALIGFTNDHIKVTEIDDDEFDIRDINIRKAYCRHIVGEIHHEDIKYLVLRIPRQLFPYDKLTQDEVNSNSQFIFRGTRLNQEFIKKEEFKTAA